MEQNLRVRSADAIALIGNEFRTGVKLAKPAISMAASMPVPAFDTYLPRPLSFDGSKPIKIHFSKLKILLYALLCLALITTFVTSRIIAASIAEPLATSNKTTASLKTLEKESVNVSIDGKIVHPDEPTIKSWVNGDEKQVTANHKSIQKYLDSLSSQYGKQPINRVVAKSSDGAQKIIADGANGVAFSVGTQTVNQISRQFLSGNGVNMNLTSHSLAFQTVEVSSAAPKVIEVDLTKKVLYAYQDGQLVKTFLVSAGAPATPTPVGQFKILYKLPIQNMRGFNANGSRYFQPNVQWISYFHGADAIHGNYWRPASWFGSVNSSHGCVGLQNFDAKWIYDWAPVGTTIITHA